MKKSTKKQMEFVPNFTKEEYSPWKEVKSFEVKMMGDHGEVLYDNPQVIGPATWSQTAVNIAASKYLSILDNSSIFVMIDRVANNITWWGQKQGYFNQKNASVFNQELKAILASQRAAFNTPVWLNVGVHKTPQTSACFLNAVEDSMESIYKLAKTEGMLFKYGSGSGTNFSTIRSSKEALSGGGKSSGPVSFMKGLDAFAGVVKSGGVSRRAAKLCILNADHPDIEEFIDCKMKEEIKIKALIAQGFDPKMEGEVYSNSFFQNANNSVRVTDAFMEAVEKYANWELLYVQEQNGNKVQKIVPARMLFKKMAKAAWECGDPGIMFHDTINTWNTCPQYGEIHTANPCNEVHVLDNTSCNLASINLDKYFDYGDDLGVPIFLKEDFQHTVRVLITAMDILIDNSSYPTPEIEQNSRTFRPLGLGFSNLGTVVMKHLLPYDSNQARSLVSDLTWMLTSKAYQVSMELANVMGNNFDSSGVLNIYNRHAYLNEGRTGVYGKLDVKHPSTAFRNSQVTVMAPTGTCGLIMDCATTGIEPELSVFKHKKLSGGGSITMLNPTVKLVLEKLGYPVEKEGRENYYKVKDEHRAIFDCALPDDEGRFISPEGHLKMLAAIQPWISGASSKTVNTPNSATVEDIEKIYMNAWKLGVKCVAVYRDGSKGVQPLTTKKVETAPSLTVSFTSTTPARRRMPVERTSVTHKFKIAGNSYYITCGMFEDGSLGEVFCVASKQGSVLGGMMESFCTMLSMGLQYGMPLETLYKKFTNSRFEPSGHTGFKDIPYAKSIIDYIFRYLWLRFGHVKPMDNVVKYEHKVELPKQVHVTEFCTICGGEMKRAGSCEICSECGTTSGCS